MAEVMPEFPGGAEALMKFLQQNARYPEVAKENGVQGRYIVGFCVTSEGKITDVEIARKPEGESLAEINVNTWSNEADSVAVNKRINEAKGREALEAEAIRLVKAMPDWKPGMQDGKQVNCRYNLPVTFKYQ